MAGISLKFTLLVNKYFQLMGVILIGGQIYDSEPTVELFKGVELKGKKVIADKAYSTEFICFYLQGEGIVVCILDKVNFKFKYDFDSELYKQRNIIKRFFQRIKNYHYIAIRY